MRKYSVENLTRLANDVSTPQRKSAQTRAAIYDTAYYGRLTEEFPTHYRSFKKMKDHELERGERVSGKFDYTTEGFINFIMDVGPIPSAMKNPTLMRVHPRKGFIRGNLTWMNGAQARRTIALAASEASRKSRLTTA